MLHRMLWRAAVCKLILLYICVKTQEDKLLFVLSQLMGKSCNETGKMILVNVSKQSGGSFRRNMVETEIL